MALNGIVESTRNGTTNQALGENGTEAENGIEDQSCVAGKTDEAKKVFTEDADVEEDYGGADESHGNNPEYWRYERELRVPVSAMKYCNLREGDEPHSPVLFEL